MPTAKGQGEFNMTVTVEGDALTESVYSGLRGACSTHVAKEVALPTGEVIIKNIMRLDEEKS